MKMKNLRQGDGKTVNELKKRLQKKSRTRGYFKKILVPLDGSKKSIRALDKAIIIASQFDSEIVLVNVVPLIPLGDARMVKKLKQDLQKKALKLLQKGKNLCKKYDVKSKIRVLSGEPGTVILRHANTKKFDLIVMGASGKGLAKELILGSVANYVLHKSKIPVLVLK